MSSSATLKFKYNDSLQKVYTENLGHLNREKVVENAFSSDTAVRTAFFENIDTACRAISALTTNVYGGADLTINLDVLEEIDGGGE